MGRALLVLWNDAKRAEAIEWIRKAPKETRVTFQGPKRTLPQNDRMWAMLTDIATQKLWHGLRLDADAWKMIFLDALHREMRIVPNLDGTGFVSLSARSSDLSIPEMTDMIELMFAWGAQNHVVFHDTAEHAA